MNRRTYFRLHQTLGLAVSAWVLLVAVTGIALTFRAELRSEPPEAAVVAQPQSLDTIVRAASEHAGGAAVTDVALPSEPGDPFVVWVDDDAETKLYLDGNGKLLGKERTAESLTRWLFELHTGATFGPLGTFFSVLTGIGLCLLVQSGVAMLWTRRRRRRPRAAAPEASGRERADHGRP